MPNNVKNLKYSILISILLFFAIFDYKILNPNYLNWFQDDTYQHWLGWSFFRETSLLQFPILKNYNFGMDSAGSLIYSDSLPLLAMIFRPFSNSLDFHFQYFGWWIFISIFLQCFFSLKIMDIFVESKIYKFISTVFFVLSPIMLFRYNMGHDSLMSQWLILCALYFYLKEKPTSYLFWLFIILFSLLIHAYFFVMILIIFLIELLKQIYKKNQKFKIVSIKLLKTILISILFMWVVGYFTIEDVFHGGYGGYRLNLLSLINPYGGLFFYPSIIPKFSFFHQTSTFGDFEGFAYLGLGMILMALILIGIGIYRFELNKIKTILKDNIFTIILIIIFTLYSLSNRIAFGPYELFQYNIPEIFKVFTSPFRASGRMFWPVYYLIYIIILKNIACNFKSRVAILIVLLALTLTIYDLKDHLRHTRLAKGIEVDKIEINNFSDKKWQNFSKKYNTIYYVFPKYAPENWKELSYYAAKNKFSINGGYWARHNTVAEQDYKRIVKYQIKNSEFDSNTLYYFNDDEYWEFAKKNIRDNDFIGKVNNFRILAPNFYQK